LERLRLDGGYERSHFATRQRVRERHAADTTRIDSRSEYKSAQSEWFIAARGSMLHP
jgi:hypothetical protein